MWRYVLKRLGMMVFVVLGVAILVFSLMYFVPGDPAMLILGSGADPADVARLRAQMGIDKPYLVQLGTFLNNLLHLDFGVSYQYNTPVIESVKERLPRTLFLSVMVIIFQTLIGIPLGITAAVNAGKWQDTFCVIVSMIGLAIPGFWLSLMSIKVFSVNLGWFPSFGIDSWKSYVLPIVTMAIGGLSMNTRQTRAAMLEVIRADYVTTAKAKGVSAHDVIYKHALPNALIPVITMIGGSFGGALGGAIIAESVFVMPGLGLYLTNAINALDYAVVRSVVVILAVWFSMIMLVTDLVYAFVDPRIKAQYTGK